mmetsp:Transcript_704/g.1243  ORF Transcript_704/g.1243 Transcript_704/m.1243 type:complete len:264 (-) Transcript_704:53-844(-)
MSVAPSLYVPRKVLLLLLLPGLLVHCRAVMPRTKICVAGYVNQAQLHRVLFRHLKQPVHVKHEVEGVRARPRFVVVKVVIAQLELPRHVVRPGVEAVKVDAVADAESVEDGVEATHGLLTAEATHPRVLQVLLQAVVDAVGLVGKSGRKHVSLHPLVSPADLSVGFLQFQRLEENVGRPRVAPQPVGVLSLQLVRKLGVEGLKRGAAPHLLAEGIRRSLVKPIDHVMLVDLRTKLAKHQRARVSHDRTGAPPEVRTLLGQQLP